MDKRSHTAVLDSPVGCLGVGLRGDIIQYIEFLGDGVEAQPAPSAAHAVVTALDEYFATGQYHQDLAIELQGTVFQRRVWQALRAIPVGQVTTYGTLAEELGSSARAVGNACRHNPIPILVPCHRVVARTGLGGFAGDRDGYLVDVKRYLLTHEGVEIDAARPHID